MTTFTSKSDFESAYQTLNATFAAGRTKSLQWRKWQLKQCWWMLEDNEDRIIEALNTELHRHPFESLAMELRGCRADILDMLEHLEEWAKGEKPDAGFIMGTVGKAWLRKEPLGVSLIMSAWNFPLYTLMSPMVAAIAAGNCLMLKPSDQAPTVQNLIANLFAQYLDQSAIRVVTGGIPETTYILEHKFNHIFYTGGSQVGRIIAAAAAKHLTPVVLELGGQAPAIVCKSANIDLAAKRIAGAKMTNSGQICLNVNHVFVEPEIHDRFVDRLVYWHSQFLAGGTDGLSRMINERHFDRAAGLLKQTAGTISFGGETDKTQKYIQPTVVTNISPSDSLMSEELFSPIAPILKSSLPDALSIINSMPHPLGLYIFSTSSPEIEHILTHTTSGGVTVNDIMTHAGVPQAPFGGVGESGYGSYHGKYGFDAFSHTRTVVAMPGFMERLLGWRYLPYDMKNRSFIDLGKVGFKRGESMADQRVGQDGRVAAAAKLLGKAAAVVAALALIDSATGGRLLFVHTLRGVGGRLRN